MITFSIRDKSQSCCIFQPCISDLTLLKKSIEIELKISHFFDHLRWFIQFAANLTLNLSVIPLFSQMFASSWLFITITDDITLELTTFNNNIKAFSGENRVRLVQRFSVSIQLYSDAKQ